MTKKLSIALFIIVALIQLYVPAEMIFHREGILKNGKEFLFKTAPIDPTDPFRGKYVRLNFQQEDVSVDKMLDWNRGDEVFIEIREDSTGYAILHWAFKDEPAEGTDYLKTTVKWIHDIENGKITVVLPFDRFYMEESKSDMAERVVQESQFGEDNSRDAVAHVHILDGDAVLRDVTLDGRSLEDIVREMQYR